MACPLLGDSDDREVPIRLGLLRASPEGHCRRRRMAPRACGSSFSVHWSPSDQGNAFSSAARRHRHRVQAPGARRR